MSLYLFYLKKRYVAHIMTCVSKWDLRFIMNLCTTFGILVVVLYRVDV